MNTALVLGIVNCSLGLGLYAFTKIADRRLKAESDLMAEMMAKQEIAKPDLYKMMACDIDRTVQQPILDYAMGKTDIKPPFADPSAYDGEIINCAIESAEVFHAFMTYRRSFWDVVLDR